MPLGIMPEIMHTIPCADSENCKWDEHKRVELVNDANDGPESAATKIERFHLRPGVVKVDDRRYILRYGGVNSSDGKC